MTGRVSIPELRRNITEQDFDAVPDDTVLALVEAVLNWADSGQCLARTPDGRWVLNSRWQAFVKATR